MSEIRLALETGSSPDTSDKAGYSAIHVACQTGRFDVVKLLIHVGCDVNKCWEGRTGLYIASRDGNVDIVRVLLDANADTQVGPDGRTPFFVACREGWLEVVQVLAGHIDVSRQYCCGISPFFEACWRGHVDVAKFLWPLAKFDVNQTTSDRATALFAASRSGHLLVVEFLLSIGADPDRSDSNGVTPFFVSCHEGHEEVCRLLATYGCSKYSKCSSGKSPLYTAAQVGNTKIVEMVIELKRIDLKLSSNRVLNSDEQSYIQSGVYCDAAKDNFLSFLEDPDIRGRTPVFAAAAAGREDVVKLLTLHGCNPDRPDNDNVTPIMMACERGEFSMVKFLASRGCRLDRPNSDPLFVASYRGHVEIVDFLLSLSLLTEKKVWGTTPLFVACQEGHVEVVKRLINAGCVLDVRMRNGATPFFAACWRGHQAVVELLGSRGCNMTSGMAGCSPCFVAVQENHIGIARYLLENQCDPDQPDVHGVTPLWFSAYKGRQEMVEMLVKYGAKVDNICYNTRNGNGGCSPCFIAIQSQHLDVVRFLLRHGCDPDLTDARGHTPLFYASGKGEVEIVKLLCDARADVHKECDGRTPLFTACRNGRLDVVRCLLSYGCNPAEKSHDVDCFQVACCYRHYEVVHELARAGYDTTDVTHRYQNALVDIPVAFEADQISILRLYDKADRPSSFAPLDVILSLPVGIVSIGPSAVAQYIQIANRKGISLAMGRHPRLGAESLLRHIPSEITERIFHYMVFSD